MEVPLYARDGSIRAVALIDDVDAETVSRYRWYLNSRGYAWTTTLGKRGQQKAYEMHRLLMGSPKGMWVDHINRNRLDNRRRNLRVVSPRASRQNVKGGGRYSKHRGVTFSPRRNRWIAQGAANGKNHFLGHFQSEEAAAQAARDFRAEFLPYATN